MNVNNLEKLSVVLFAKMFILTFESRAFRLASRFTWLILMHSVQKCSPAEDLYMEPFRFEPPRTCYFV